MSLQIQPFLSIQTENISFILVSESQIKYLMCKCNPGYNNSVFICKGQNSNMNNHIAVSVAEMWR